MIKKRHPYYQASDLHIYPGSFPNYYMFLKSNKPISDYGGEYYQKDGITFDTRINLVNNPETDEYKNYQIFFGHKENAICYVGIHDPLQEQMEIYEYGSYQEYYETSSRKAFIQNMMQVFIEFIKERLPNIKKIIMEDIINFGYRIGNRFQNYPYYLYKYGSNYLTQMYDFIHVDYLDLVMHKENVLKARNYPWNYEEFRNFAQKYIQNKDNENNKKINHFCENSNKYQTIKELLDEYKFKEEDFDVLRVLMNYFLIQTKTIAIYGARYYKII